MIFSKNLRFGFSLVLLKFWIFFINENEAVDPPPICPCGIKPPTIIPPRSKDQNSLSESSLRNSSDTEMGKILYGVEVDAGAPKDYYWQSNAVFLYDPTIPTIPVSGGLPTAGIPIVGDRMAHFCSASIIGNSWILLAAHCCVRYDKVVLNLPLGIGSVILPTGVLAALFPLPIDLLVGQFYPILGYPDWTNATTVSVSFGITLERKIADRKKIKKIFKHPNFSWKDFGHDLCLLQLQDPIDRLNYGPLCLPSEGEDLGNFLAEQRRDMSGFGVTQCSDSATLPDKLRKTENLWTYRRDKCEIVFPQGIHADVCCVESKPRTPPNNPTVPYSGDSGSGIRTTKTVTDGLITKIIDIHAATLSFGYKCNASDPNQNTISGASATSPDIKWIQETISLAEQKPFNDVICPTPASTPSSG